MATITTPIETTVTVTALGRLAARMALDADLHQQYLLCPDEVIETAGLSANEEQALRDGDWTAILPLLGPMEYCEEPLPKEGPSGSGSGSG